MCMCVYVGLSAAYVSVCMCVYVCVYVCICVYMYVCICMRVCMYICVYACMHICVIIIINSHGLCARRCPMPVSSTSSNFLCPTPSVHICVCMHNRPTCICLGGNVRWENVLLKTGGGIVRGELSMANCPERNCPGDYCPTPRSSIAKLQISANYSKIPTRAWMIGVL